MIVSYNVCDFCGNQEEVKKDMCSGVVVSWSVISSYQHQQNKYPKSSSGSFCDIDCFIEFLKKSDKERENAKSSVKV